MIQYNLLKWVLIHCNLNYIVNYQLFNYEAKAAEVNMTLKILMGKKINPNKPILITGLLPSTIKPQLIHIAISSDFELLKYLASMTAIQNPDKCI